MRSTSTTTKCQPEPVQGRHGQQARAQIGCQRGGYPKVGVAVRDWHDAVAKVNKCTLCYGRAGADGVVDAAPTLPTRAATSLPTRSDSLPRSPLSPSKAHEPACVSTCPAKAMKWDTQGQHHRVPATTRPTATCSANGTQNWIGNGAMFWASKKVLLTPPKADPFIEDHMAPMRRRCSPSSTLRSLFRRSSSAASWRCPRVVPASKKTSAITEEV